MQDSISITNSRLRKNNFERQVEHGGCDIIMRMGDSLHDLVCILVERSIDYDDE